MRRFFFATVFMILAVGVGWRYAPQDARQRLLQAVGVVGRVDPAGIAQGIKNKVMPEDPVARRAALTTELKEKITQMKNIAAGENKGVSSGTANGAVTTIEQAADEAGQLVQQLQEVNKDPSISGQVIQRVLDKILPATQCK